MVTTNDVTVPILMATIRSRVTRCECDIPVDRFAHSFVCDSTQDCYYMFGGHQGNVAQASSNMMRLDDFWKMQV